MSYHDLYFGGKSIKVILCGQKSFGAAVLQLLERKENIEVAAVYAPADDKLAEPAVHRGYEWHHAGSLRSDTMPEQCDLLVAAHSHDFVSRKVRNKLRLGAIGYHPSLLPRHRGRDAVKWTIRMRDPIAGGTVFWLNDTVDGGPIAAQEWCWVNPEDDASTLWKDSLFPIGIRLLSETIDDIQNGRLIMKDQDQRLATWEPPLDGHPRLFRPELLQIGSLPDGFSIEK